MSRKRREDKQFEELQDRKKRRLEESRRRSGVEANPAKSLHRESGRKKRRGEHKREKKQPGTVFLLVQAIVSAVFMIALLLLNMLPLKYLAAAVLILVVLLILTAYMIRKHGLSGRVLSVILTLILAVGSFYIFKTYGAILNISGGSEKIDKMVVAVLTDDPAQSIQDAKDYTFGVQYSIKGEQTTDTIEQINSELGGSISTYEYGSLGEQAQALRNGYVRAIIYNEAYTDILEDVFDGYSDSIRIIYSYSISSTVATLGNVSNVTEEPFAVYISGIDVYGAIETNSRSDVNIIAVVNPNTRQILLVTTPRDYYVEIPGISGGQKDKLTHAGVYGVDISVVTLEQLYDTDIDFYARVNFTSLIEMVDALGGIDVESKIAFTTSKASGAVVDIQNGTNRLNGEEALAFCRERKNLDDGDNQRGKHQQAVLTAMIKKMMTPAILTSANGILNSVQGNAETNMGQSQIQSLVKMQLSEGGSWNIISMAAEGTGDKQYCYSYSDSALYVTLPDAASVAEISAAIDSVMNGDLLIEQDE